MSWKAYPSLILFCGLSLYVGLGGDIPRDPQCFGSCHMNVFGRLIDDGYRYVLAVGLFLSGVFSFFWEKLNS